MDQPAPTQLDDLPLELKVHILSYLAPKEKQHMRLASTGWKDVVNGSGLVEFNVQVSDSNVGTFKKMSLGTMGGIKSLSVSHLKNDIGPLGTELKQLLLTTQKLSFGSSILRNPFYCTLCVRICYRSAVVFRAENILIILKACRNIRELEFRFERLNEIPNQFPVFLKNVQLEILDTLSIMFNAEADTTLLLGILQLNAPSLREFRVARISSCSCIPCKAYFNKDVYVGVWKFIVRHAESLKTLALNNVGYMGLLSELLPPGMALRPRGFEYQEQEHSARKIFVRIKKFVEFDKKFFDAAPEPELDYDEQLIMAGIGLLQLTSLSVYQKNGGGETHDGLFLKELIQTQVGLQVLKVYASPPTLRSLMLENIGLNKDTLVELQLVFDSAFVPKVQLLKKYYEGLKCLKIFKLEGRVGIEDYAQLPSTITTLIIDAPELSVQDFNGICSQLLNLEDFTLHHNLQPYEVQPPQSYSFGPIFYKMLASLKQLKRLNVGLPLLTGAHDSIREFCETDPNLSYTLLDRFKVIDGAYPEPNVLIEIQR